MMKNSSTTFPGFASITKTSTEAFRAVNKYHVTIFGYFKVTYWEIINSDKPWSSYTIARKIVGI